jgi:hypothetical protein
MFVRFSLAVVGAAVFICGCGKKEPAAAPPDLPKERREAAAKLRATDAGKPVPAFAEALAKILDDAAAANDADVNVVWTEKVEDVDSDEERAELKQSRSFFQNGSYSPDVLTQRRITDPEFRADREKLLLESFAGSWKGIADERLLAPTVGDSQRGTPTIEVHTVYRLAPKYVELHLVNAAYLMQDLEIACSVKFVSREGAVLSSTEFTESPGTFAARVESGEWQYATPDHQAKYLGDLATRAQLQAAFGQVRKRLAEAIGRKGD